MCAFADVKTYTHAREKYIDISRYIYTTDVRVYVYKYMCVQSVKKV